jgi:uncharacterized protein YcfJ
MTLGTEYILLGVGAVALMVQKGAGVMPDGTPIPPGGAEIPKPTTPAPVVGSRPTTVTAVVAAKAGTSPILKGTQTTSTTAWKRTTSGNGNGIISDGGGNYTKGADVLVNQTLNEVEAEVKREYEKLTSAAKKKGAELLNETLKPSPNLTGKENFKEASKKVGAVVGAAAGAAVCSIAGVGAGAVAAPLCAWLGSIAGAYLGEKIGKWAKDTYKKVAKWTQNSWDSVKDKAKSVAKKICFFC